MSPWQGERQRSATLWPGQAAHYGFGWALSRQAPEYRSKQPSDPVVPKLPSTGILLGPSKSGKTVALISMILEQYRGCFERIYIFSPSRTSILLAQPVDSPLCSCATYATASCALIAPGRAELAALSRLALALLGAGLVLPSKTSVQTMDKDGLGSGPQALGGEGPQAVAGQPSFSPRRYKPVRLSGRSQSSAWFRTTRPQPRRPPSRMPSRPCKSYITFRS